MLSVTKDKLFLALRKAFVLLILYFLQNLFTRLPVMGAAPLFLPAAAIAIALIADSEWSAGWGLLAGLLCDISVGDSLLMFTITLMVAGLAAGFLAEFYFSRSFVTYLIFAILTNALTLALQLIPPVFFKGIDVNLLYPVAIVQFLYSVIFIPPIYFFAKRVSIAKRDA
ncbi:MAG: hypothetical protein LBN43_07755 [Oscillospiraceae bacterium]|jgi:hypothetical protein|nr:hypothetical protein [Oscillospiraceae bacterium]